MTTTAMPPREIVGGPDGPQGEPREWLGWVAAVIGLLIGIAAVAAGLVGLPALVLSLPFLYMLARKPILRRLAFRNSARRPRETMLVILGALLGTAIITSSYVVGDTLRTSIRQSAYAQLGPVDEVVASSGTQSGAAVRAAVERANITGVDGILPIQTLVASVATSGAAAKAEPRAQVLETDFGAARRFGGDPAATGMSGPTPGSGEAVVGTNLADTLGVEPGDTITIRAYGASKDLRVTRVLPQKGIAGLLTFDANSNSSPNVFVAPGTIDALEQAGSATSRTAQPPTSLLAVSNAGDVIAGADGTAAVQRQLAVAVEGLPARVIAAKKTLLDNADRAGNQFTSFFQNFGYFSVLAGILLLVNIFVMLAQERKNTLGMLRAVGLRRASLVGSFSLEGWLYALGAAITGTVVGLAVGRLVVIAASSIFQQGRGGAGSGLNLRFAVTTNSIRSGFTLGFIIALATVVITSFYIARLNIIRAIRDLPEPSARGKRTGRRILGIALGVIGAAVTAGAMAGSSPVLGLIGPALLGFGVISALGGGARRRRIVISIVSLFVLVWSVFGITIVGGKTEFVVFVVQGVVLTGYAIALVTQNQETIGAAVRAVAGGARNMSMRLGLAYPLAKRFRTGLTLGMYAIVVFVLTLLVTISSLFSGQEAQFIAKLGGTAAIVVESNASDPIPAADLTGLSGVSHVAVASETTAEFPKAGSTDAQPVKVVGFDEAFIGHGTPQLKTKARGTTTAEETWRSVLTTPGTVVVSQDFTPGGQRRGGPGGGKGLAVGQRIIVRDSVTGVEKPLTVGALVSEARYDGFEHVYVSRATAQQVFGDRATPNLAYVSTKAGTDNDALAASISGRFVANGARANSFHHLVSVQFSQQQQFFQLIKGYVALGLLVGIAGLGVVMVRAVRERRREVGVLRALGFSRVAVRRAFVAESAFIALEGILIGSTLALITCWQLVSSNSFGNGISFGIPFLQLAPWLVGAFIASLLATASPAQQAARIRPAVALRIAD